MRKIWVLLEIKFVLLLIIFQIWAFGHNYTPVALAFVIVFAGWILRKETLVSLGFINWKWALFTVLTFVGNFIRKGHPLGHGETEKIIFFFLWYQSWGLIQQMALNPFLVKRLKELGASDNAAVLLAGTIFSALHYPNPVLMPITLIGGIFLSYIFLKVEKKNLYILALLQAAAATIIHFTVPAAMHHNFRIGPGYSTWTPNK